MSQREDSKIILYLNPYDICTGDLTLIIVFSQWRTGATAPHSILANLMWKILGNGKYFCFMVWANPRLWICCPPHVWRGKVVPKIRKVRTGGLVNSLRHVYGTLVVYYGNHTTVLSLELETSCASNNSNIAM